MLYPDNSLNLVENFLRLSFGLPAEQYEVDPVIAKALDLLLILHADHEQNCSTSTVRLVGSSNANLFASVSAGINALFGPAHGGANEAVLKMLRQIQADGTKPEDYMEKVKNKEDGVRLMGFGHRVYKNYDPRAKIVKATAHEILSKLGGNDELLDIAMRLEEKALNDDYFIQRKLYPNVDFYTGLIYKAMGFPEKMFTVLFAIGRLPGWIAQWREMISDPNTKIGRPRQLYIGEPERDYPARCSALIHSSTTAAAHLQRWAAAVVARRVALQALLPTVQATVRSCSPWGLFFCQRQWSSHIWSTVLVVDQLRSARAEVASAQKAGRSPARRPVIS